MDVRTNESARGWKALVLLVAIVWLAGCKVQTQGLVELRDANGEAYSFAGATVSLFPLNAASVMPGQSGTPLATATVAPEGGAVMLAAPRISLRASRWFVVEFRCPANAPDDGCDVATPLHVVLTGAALRAGGWRATALTETAFHAVVFGAMSGFTPEEIQQVLDHTAQVLLAGSYQNLLAWNPADTAALQRPGTLPQLSTALADGITNNNLKRLAQQWVSLSRTGALSIDFALTANLVVEGAHAYRARSGGLDIIDVRDPQNPVLLSQLSLSGTDWVQDVVQRDGFVYMTSQRSPAGTSTLQVIDVRDPLNPVLASQLPFQREIRFFDVAGDFLFVAESYSDPHWSHALSVIDIRDPLHPVQVASLPLERGANPFAISGQHLYMDTSEGLTIVDISNPLVPVVAGVWQEMRVYGPIAAAGDKLYLSEGKNEIVVVDVSTPMVPTRLATLTFDWLENIEYIGAVSAIYPVGSELYVTLGGEIHRIDVSDPAAPRWAGAVAAPDPYIRAVAVAQGHLYIAELYGLHILSLNAFEGAPVLAGRLDVPGGLSSATAATTRVAYSPVGDNGLYIIDLYRPRAPTLLKTDKRFKHVFQVNFAEPIAYLGDYYTFYALDITNPVAPVELPGTIPLQERGYQIATGMEIVGDYAYLSARWENRQDNDRLIVLDLSDPQVPVLTTQVMLPVFSELIAAAGNKAYVMMYTDLQLLTVLDIQNPLLPQLAGSLELPVQPGSAVAAGDYLYLACGSAGLLVVDASDPLQPTLVTTVTTAGSVSSITLVDGYAFVADSAAGIVLLDLANPAAPVVVGNASVRGSARGAFVQNGLLYVSTSAGLDVLKKPRVAVSSN